MSYIKILDKLANTYNGGEQRFYVNNTRITLEGVVTYESADFKDQQLASVGGLVGLVDNNQVDNNHDGTIAWGELDDMEILADLLNKAHIVEQLMRS